MNKVNYESFIKGFSITTVENRFVGSFEDGFNVCEEICDRYAESRGVALRYERVDGSSGELSFLLKAIQSLSSFCVVNIIGK